VAPLWLEQRASSSNHAGYGGLHGRAEMEARSFFCTSCTNISACDTGNKMFCWDFCAINNFDVPAFCSATVSGDGNFGRMSLLN